MPTAGAILRLYGSNLGDAPTMMAAFVPQVALQPCPGMADQSCYTGSAPPGEGDGRQSDFNGTHWYSYGSFILTLNASDQSAEIIMFRYLSPSILAVAPGSTAGLPTQGGSPVIIRGANFGVSILSYSSSISVVLVAPTTLQVREENWCSLNTCLYCIAALAGRLSNPSSVYSRIAAQSFGHFVYPTAGSWSWLVDPSLHCWPHWIQRDRRLVELRSSLHC